MPALVTGTVVSFAVAYLTIGWLLRYVQHHTFDAFVLYRLGVAALLVALLVSGVVKA